MAAMWTPFRFPVALLLPVCLLVWSCSATQPRGSHQNGLFLGVARSNDSKTNPEAKAESTPGTAGEDGEDKEIAAEEDMLKASGKEAEAPGEKAPAEKGESAPAVKGETKGEAKAESAPAEKDEKVPAEKDGSAPAEKDAGKGNETKAEDGDKATANESKVDEEKGNESKVLNETEAKEAKAAWDEWYEKRSTAMWSKCEGMPICVKLCRWIRIALTMEYGDEETAFKAADADGDGKVSLPEFVDTATKAGVTDDKMAVKGYAILYVMDINEDGFVSERNFQKLVSVAKAGDQKDADEYAKKAAEEAMAAGDDDKKKEEAKKEETKKTPEEEKAEQKEKHKKMMEELKKEVDAHEEELDKDMHDEAMKELMQDHPPPKHHPAPHTYEVSNEPAAESPAAQTAAPTSKISAAPQAEIEHAPSTKSSCRRSAAAASALLVIAVLMP